MGDARIYVRAGVSARRDSPSVLVLLAKGYEIEHVDPVYDSFLMSKAEAPTDANSSGDPLPPPRRDRLPLRRRGAPDLPRPLGGLAPAPALVVAGVVLALFLLLVAAGELVARVFTPEHFDGAGEVVAR